MDIVEEYANMIASLSESHFNELVVEFNREYWETKEVVISNGPYDGGIDMIVKVDGIEMKKSIQITVQKTGIEKKVMEDAEKAKANTVNYGYLNKLELYISRPISKSTQNKLKKDSMINYSIDLSIYGPNELAHAAKDYLSIGRFLREIYMPNLASPELLKVDKQTKVLYDILALGTDTTKVKHQFIHSLILYFVYENDNCNDEIVRENLNKKIGLNYDTHFYRNQLFSLRDLGSIIVSEDKRKFSLSDVARNSLEQASNLVASQEKNLSEEVKAVLEKYNMEAHATELVSKVLNLFDENYSIDIESNYEEVENLNEDLKRLYRDIRNFFDAKSRDIDSKQAALDLLAICSNNTLLNKISVSKLFIGLYRSNKLEIYLKNKTRKVVLDTQVLLQLICSSYKDVAYDNLWYKSVLELSKIWSSSQDKYILVTTDGYVKEVVNHLIEAYKVDLFLNGFNDKALGASNNVFYSYYLFLQKEGYLDCENFAEFVEDAFGINPDDYSNEFHLKNALHNSIQDMLGYIQVSVIAMMDYNSKFKDDLRRAYEESLIANRKNKSSFALMNDVDAIVYLSTSENHFDSSGQLSEPFFITWDSSLQHVRSIVDRVSNTSNYWYLYTPARLLDRLSVMRFSLNPRSVTSNIIALAEYNYNNSSKVNTSFVDLLHSLSGNQKLNSWALGLKLAKIRKDQSSSEIEDTKSPYKNLPIETVLLEINKHYRANNSKHTFSKLVAVFSDDKLQNVVLAVVERYANTYKPGSILGKELFMEIDAIIENLED